MPSSTIWRGLSFLKRFAPVTCNCSKVVGGPERVGENRAEPCPPKYQRLNVTLRKAIPGLSLRGVAGFACSRPWTMLGDSS